jgi:hypothetical protein
VAAAINLRTSDPLTESGHDPVVELRHYYGTVASELTLNWQVRGCDSWSPVLASTHQDRAWHAACVIRMKPGSVQAL